MSEVNTTTTFDQFVADLEVALPKIDNFGESRWNVKKFFIISVANPSFPVTGKYGDACADGFWVLHNNWLGYRHIEIAARVTPDGKHVEVYLDLNAGVLQCRLEDLALNRMNHERWSSLVNTALHSDEIHSPELEAEILEYLFSEPEEEIVS